MQDAYLDGLNTSYATLRCALACRDSMRYALLVS